MDETTEEKPSNNKAEVQDELYADSRLRIEMILVLLAEKLQARVEKALEEKDDEGLTKSLDHLERVIMFRQMNVAKTKDLQAFMPKKYKRIVSDDEIKKRLRPLRDEEEMEPPFPKRGPRGPREDAAAEAET